MNKIKRVRILDVPVDNIDMTFCLKYISALIKKNTTGNYILAINPEKIIVLQKEYHLKQVFENAALLIPDGIGVVLAMRWLFSFPVKRIPGADLMQNICKIAAKKGHKIFIYGSKEQVNKKAVEKLNTLHPKINIVGRCNGYIREEKMDKLINKINSSEADILFVGLGSPKQEKWIQEYLPRLNVKVCQGIGGTLDTITGDTKRAPWYFQKAGVEWFYRLIKDPKRFRRQAILPVFAFRVMKEKLTGRLP